MLYDGPSCTYTGTIKIKYIFVWIVDEAIGIVQRAIGNVVFGGL
jgi:hypothetical protein